MGTFEYTCHQPVGLACTTEEDVAGFLRERSRGAYSCFRHRPPGSPRPSVRRHLVAFWTGVQGLSERGTLVGFRALHPAPRGVSGVPGVGVGGKLIRGKERHVSPQAVSLEGLHRQGDLEAKKKRKKIKPQGIVNRGSEPNGAALVPYCPVSCPDAATAALLQERASLGEENVQELGFS